MAFAAALLLFLVPITAAPGRADGMAPCQSGLDDAQRALMLSTSARRVRTTPVSTPPHLFRTGHQSACVRMRFVIAADGRARDVTLEHVVPAPLFGRAALRQLEAMEFTPSTQGGDEALVIVVYTMDEAAAAAAPR